MDISVRFVTGICLATIAMILISPLLGENWYFHGYLSEFGFVENATFAFLLVGVWFLAKSLRMNKQIPREIIVFIVLLLFASIYFAGEEVDWGQVWFESIETPDVLANANREGQFNLHKLKHPLLRLAFSRAPRLVATLVMAVGIFFPLLANKKGWFNEQKESKFHQLRWWLLPRKSFVFPCALATFASVASNLVKEKIQNAPDGYLELVLRKPSGELKEYFIALAIMVYAWSFHNRLLQKYSESTNNE